MDLKKHRNFIIQFLYYGILAGLLLLFIRYPLPYLAPFIIGWLIAYVLKKPIQWAIDKTKLPRSVVSIVIMLLFYAVVVTICVFLGIELVNVGIKYFTEIPTFYRSNVEPYLYTLYEEITEFISQLDPDVEVQFSNILNTLISKAGEVVTTVSMNIVAILSSILTKVPGLVLKLFITIISSIIIAIDYQKVNAFIINQFNEQQEAVIWEIQNYLIGTVFATLRSYFFIMCITAAELTLGLTLIGIKNPLTIGCSIAVLDILPVLGSGTVLIPWAIVRMISGTFWTGIKLLILYVVITVIRQIIEPHIVAKQMGLHPLVTLASMFIGLQAFGFFGLLGMPILLSLINHLNKKGIIHLYNNS